MAGSNYYLLTSLPVLGDLATAPPLTLQQLREHVAEVRSAAALVDAVLLEDDLLQRQAVLAGELQAPHPAVLSVQQVKDEQPLPEYLVGEVEDMHAVAGDAVWAAYFRWASNLASRQNSTFLREWVRNEVSLRNALAAHRAAALGLEAADYLVAPELGGYESQLQPAVAQWASSANPLAGTLALDRSRMEWINQHAAYYSFSDDELAAYAARLMLLHRWWRLSAQQNAAAASSGQ